jgi:TPR repeat protein
MSESDAIFENCYSNCQWVMSSAQRGNPESMNMLGVLYMLGNGLPLTTIEAEKWFCRAIKSGHETAARNLGLMMAGTIYYLERVKKVGDPIDPPCSSAE